MKSEEFLPQLTMVRDAVEAKKKVIEFIVRKLMTKPTE
jgi:hypothetical protein